MLRRAPHIIQRFMSRLAISSEGKRIAGPPYAVPAGTPALRNPPDIPANPNPRGPRRRGRLPGGARWGKADGDSPNQILLTEFMARGNLEMWMCRSNAAVPFVPYPEETIWYIFRGLVLGCVDMKFPPRLQRVPEHGVLGQPLKEDIPDANAAGRDDRDIVNMDISLNNIFVGDFDVADVVYSRIPIHKVLSALGAVQVAQFAEFCRLPTLDVRHRS